MKPRNLTHSIGTIPAMNFFKRLSLVTAVLMLCGSAFSQEPEKGLDVSAMSKAQLQKLTNKEPLAEMNFFSLGKTGDVATSHGVRISVVKASPYGTVSISSGYAAGESRTSLETLHPSLCIFSMALNAIYAPALVPINAMSEADVCSLKWVAIPSSVFARERNVSFSQSPLEPPVAG